MVNREPGAGARQQLDKELADKGIDPRQLSGYEIQATGHLQVTAAIAAGLADAGVARRIAASVSPPRPAVCGPNMGLYCWQYWRERG